MTAKSLQTCESSCDYLANNFLSQSQFLIPQKANIFKTEYSELNSSAFLFGHGLVPRVGSPIRHLTTLAQSWAVTFP